MKIFCPKCNRMITGPNLNAESDVAVCHDCGEAFELSSLVAASCDEGFDIDHPPQGAWFNREIRGWRLGASTRSMMAYFLVPFLCIWSGLSLGGIYGGQIIQGQFYLGLSLFGLPFVFGTLFVGGHALMSICGRVDVRVVDSEGTIFTGVGPIGWTRKFSWSEIRKIEEDLSYFRHSGSNGITIAMIGKTTIKFGSLLSDLRRQYLLNSLRTLRKET